MALQDSYTTGDDGQENVTGQYAAAQIFTASATYALDTIEVYINKNGSGGAVDVFLWSVNGSGLPFAVGGSEYSLGQLDSSGLSGNTWVSVDMSAYELQGSTEYSIVLVQISDGCVWRRDGSSPTYAGGHVALSSDYGVNWSKDDTKDFLFKINGDLVFSPPAARETKKRLIGIANDALWYEDL